LATLQAQVDDLDQLKSAYHHEVMEAEEEVSVDPLPTKTTWKTSVVVNLVIKKPFA
jgi:hypothetical protein